MAYTLIKDTVGNYKAGHDAWDDVKDIKDDVVKLAGLGKRAHGWGKEKLETVIEKFRRGNPSEESEPGEFEERFSNE